MFVPSTIIRGHEAPVYAVAVSQDYVYTGSSDFKIRRTSIVNHTLDSLTITTESACISIATMGKKWLSIGLLNGDFHLIDVEVNEEVLFFPFGEGGVFSVTEDPSNERFFIGLASGNCAEVYTSNLKINYLKVTASDKIRKLIYIPEKQRLLMASRDGWIHLLDTDSQQSSKMLLAHEGGVSSMVMSETGTLITGGKDGFIRVWDDSLTMVNSFPAHRGVIYDLLLMDEWLVSASRDKSIKVWGKNNFNPVQKMVVHRQSVNALAQQNEHSFVSVSDDGQLIFWTRDE